MATFMKKRKILLGLLFFIIFIFFTPNHVSRAQVENIWGVSRGDSRIYQIQREFHGDFNGIAEKVILEYYIMNNYDLNSNNVTDIALAVTDITTTPTRKYLLDLMDGTWWIWRVVEGWERNDFVNFYFKGFSNQSLIDTIKRPFPLSWTFFILPLKGNDSLHSGVNWTFSLNYINGSIPNYLVYDLGDTVKISVDKINVLHPDFNTYYNDTGEIIWEKATGWLDSIYLTRTYDTPLNYTISITVDSLSSTNPSITLSDLLSWIGLTLGIGGLTFMTYVFIKYRRLYREEQ
ncbi:MAG: hypothetical protein HWN66_00635 [Candidatus Helarchaeota archaeon]|nr:hypothetical protein [Candidatus Helarchaeota archaeon]